MLFKKNKALMKSKLTTLLIILLFTGIASAQHSIARQWNEKVLEGIRADFARPTVHARNLFHTSVAMYDAWAIYNNTVDTYLLGQTVNGYTSPLLSFHMPEDIQAAQEEAISYAMFRILEHRFVDAPEAVPFFLDLEEFMDSLGYDPSFTGLNYSCSSAAMGNYIAQQIIAYGLQDNSNESDAYANRFYEPVNSPLAIFASGNPGISDFNRWQPLRFQQFVDQGGNLIGSGTIDFLSPEWGQVLPFSLQEEDATIYQRDGFDYWVYHDPGPPAYLLDPAQGGLPDEYRWGHSMVAVWSSHLDPSDGVMWDISPATIGNISDYPTDIPSLRDFYNTFEGGDPGTGHNLNPKTNQPYPPQIVPRADYARVLAEFWADGPDSETPPGHWFTILNYVNDHPDLEKKFKGEGAILDDLEWDVKSYFILGGAMHDVAIASWGIKGWYDYIRPVSSIRGMAERGQCSEPSLISYDPDGLPLIPGYIEIITEGDSLEGYQGAFIGEMKIKAWRGPNYIEDPEVDVAGVDWIRAKQWMPYQRPTFVTPPFAGYVSGHSTYSRAAAEILTELTGDPFFPGGVGEFFCPENDFLVFEKGPSKDITLQWATYRDASDQCSLSRIWGGIHPPVDDIPGRLIGREIGIDAFNFAEQFFTKSTSSVTVESLKLFPNPTNCLVNIEYDFDGEMEVDIFQIDGRLVRKETVTFIDQLAILNVGELPFGVYVIVGKDANGERIFEEKVISN